MSDHSLNGLGLTNITFMALGGGREIGANSFYYEIDGHGLLIDAGLHPEKLGWDAFPRVKSLEGHTVDTFLVTHAHTDHLGAVPYLMQHYPKAPVYATSETIELARIMLSNSASLLPKQHPQEVIDALTNYTLDALPDVIGKLQPLELGETKQFGDGRLRATYYSSGHILGAAGVLIETDGKRIFHTGDTSLHAQRLIGGAKLPDGPIDVLVSESTNGIVDAYLTHTREREIERLVATINETFANEGSVLIPVFALGKLQEMLATLDDAMKAGKLPRVPIYTGGMGRRISDVYDQFPMSRSRTNFEDRVAEIEQSELPRRDALFSGKYFHEPSIVLAASGMMQDGTPSYFLAQRWLRIAHFAICFVGYTDPRTPGYTVSHAEKGTRIKFGSMKRDVPVRCRIERFRFSAHARREELLEIVRRLRPKKVVLTHGDERAIAAFGELIVETFPDIEVSAPEVGKWYSI
ncbi:MAG: MBL fold metallo-hydrolase [Bacteroidota bacterium]|nr:MBL fold metallo-hydrolase [Bacteroidota bacterium]MDP4232548.1 MBL fold metallo-hydrolase [Bacteroidota bacterium]MDP4286428.1 MBL fold metallo-hydrolase [Bacteroidota bacterium]